MTAHRRSINTGIPLALLAILWCAGGGACARGTGPSYARPPAGSGSDGPPLAAPRAGHAAVLLADETVAVFGGVRIPPRSHVGEECGLLVDLVVRVEALGPADTAWREAASLSALAATAAVVVPVGPTAVLIVGGEGADGSATNGLATVDIATGRLWFQDLLPESRARAAGVRLADGSVLVTGGIPGPGPSPSETIRIDPTTLAVRRAAAPSVARSGHGAALLPDGSVLVVGGWGPGPTASVERYDPLRDAWSDAAPLPTPRTEHRVVASPLGAVVIGGSDAQGAPVGSVLRFDPEADGWTELGKLSEPREDPAVAVLPDGSIVVTGGRGARAAPTAAVDVVTADGRVRPLPPLGLARVLHTATALDATTVLVVGGLIEEGGELRSTDSVEYYAVTGAPR